MIPMHGMRAYSLGMCLAVPRKSWPAAGADLLSADHVSALQGLILRRQQGEPVAYIIGKKEFMGLAFAVDGRVLIPRPETELLVEKALDLFGCESSSGRHSLGPPTLHDIPQPLIADIGTGSGAIGVSIAQALPQATVYATDISADALALAQRNAVAHGVSDRLVMLEGSYLQALPETVHVIVCNPPYIPRDEIPGLDRDVRGLWNRALRFPAALTALTRIGRSSPNCRPTSIPAGPHSSSSDSIWRRA